LSYARSLSEEKIICSDGESQRVVIGCDWVSQPVQAVKTSHRWTRICIDNKTKTTSHEKEQEAQNDFIGLLVVPFVLSCG